MTNKANANNPQSIADKLASFSSASGPSWVTVALLLLQFEESGHLKSENRSLNAFVGDVAIKLNKEKSMLWRYRRALLFHRQLNPDVNVNSLQPEELKQLEGISPNNLDLLEKISRVLPDRDFKNLAKRVYSKQIIRKELQEKWRALKGTLEGKTARGKGVKAPKAPPKKMKSSRFYHVDQIFTWLQEIRPSWLGITAEDRYLILRASDYHFLDKYRVDAMVVVIKANTDYMEFHAIEIKIMGLSGILKNYPDIELFDYFWLVIKGGLAAKKRSIREVPAHIGIVIIDDGMNVNVDRYAMKTQGSASKKLVIANDILLHLLL